MQGGRGESKFAKTLGQSKLLKNQLTTALLKTYLWFTTDIPAKREKLDVSSSGLHKVPLNLIFQNTPNFEFSICYLFIFPKKSVL